MDCQTGRGTDLSTSPVPIHRLEFGLEWPPWTAAAYLVATDDPVLVDAGVPGDEGEAELRDGLAEYGYDPADVGHVVLTHPHSDHLGQVPTLREAGARVVAARPTRERLRRDPDDLAAAVERVCRGVGLPDGEIPDQIDRALDSLRRNRRLLDPDGIDHAFAFGESFEAGGLAFDPVHTPGHQADHASFAVGVGGEDLLFSGDALVATFRAAALNVGFDDGAYGAVDDFYAGYDRLDGREFDRVFPGHGPVFEDAAGALADSRADLDSLLAGTLDAVRAVGPASPYDLTRERVGEYEHLARLFDTVGALGALERRGRVERVDSGAEGDDGPRRYRVRPAGEE
ncbi:MBL fold metallo-hydrolase [Halomarina litorea]|uniref:MBL fold metallo-hydrolase n=1 Tax=Halomarina litorea TaxID=2961595 RepID=UPI0020C35AA4|nr:MBL fold metallo-hydrolase [Halomarina sp. BCD28]